MASGGLLEGMVPGGSSRGQSRPEDRLPLGPHPYPGQSLWDPSTNQDGVPWVIWRKKESFFLYTEKEKY